MKHFKNNGFVFQKSILSIFCSFCISIVVFSQNESDLGGRKFTKVIEYNIGGGGLPNLKRKTDIEILLFPDKNSKVEFFVKPSFSGAYGFCIDRGSTQDKYILTAKQVSNWREVHDALLQEFPPKSVSMKTSSKISNEERKNIVQANRDRFDIINEKALQRYIIDENSVTISTQLYAAIYDCFTALIKNFTFSGVPRVIKDGYTVTFKCVVVDEVWTFIIQLPNGKFGQLTKICNEIFKDAKEGTLIEEKYCTLLKNIAN